MPAISSNETMETVAATISAAVNAVRDQPSEPGVVTVLGPRLTLARVGPAAERETRLRG